MRARFEETRKEKDMRKLAAMVEAGEEEIFQNQAVAPFIYKNDEGGITYNRQAHIEDQVLNDWHPWEKVSAILKLPKILLLKILAILQANYIDYFNKRAEMAEEMQAYWENSLSKKFAKPPSDEYPIISPEVAALK